MWTLSWLLDLLGPELAERAQRDGVDRETLLEAEAAATPAGSDGLLTVLDWLATTDQPHRKGIMLGFDARHTRGHLYRSVMEAIAMSMAVYSEAMMHELGRPIHSVIASGGGSRSALFTSIIADAVAAPVFAADEPASPASRGAAICARAAIDGVSPTDVQRSWARPRRVTNPHPERSAVYRDLRPFVTDHIRTANDPILRALSNIEKAPR
jgi:sugar (pentulose or hexulose) kinase